MIVLFSECLRRLRIRYLRLIELAQIRIRKSDVVENDGGLIAHAESLVAGEASLIGFERFLNVAPDARDSAEILIDHRHRFGILDGFRRASGFPVHQLGAIEIAACLVHDGDDVERLRDRRRGSGRGRGGDCSLENIDRRTAIPLLQVYTSQPAKRRQSRPVIGVGISDQYLVVKRRFAPASFAFRQLGLIDDSLNGRPFPLSRACSGTHAHDEARMVRRTDPSSRSFLASVGREMPRMRAAALRFPPVMPIVVWIASSTIAWSDFPSAGMRITPPAGVSTSGMKERRCSERWWG